MSTSRIVALVTLVIGLGALIGALAFVQPWRSDRNTPAEITLTASTGETIRLNDLVGRPHLMFFGFTNCPDVCPTTLTQLSQALERLGSDDHRIRAYFVTVDPERDTAAVLANYIASFDPRLIGLTGSRADIDAMIQRFRVIARKVATGSGYVYDHSTAIYMIDGAGQRIGVLNIDRPIEAVASDIKALAARR